MNRKYALLLSAAIMYAPLCFAEDVPEPVKVSADACDDRRADDDKDTAEYRAIDKASLAAVKLSGIIQKYNNDLGASAMDVISYQIIDNYMHEVTHEITLNEIKRICVKVNAVVSVTADEMNAMIEEYKAIEPPHLTEAADVAEIAESVNNTLSFKPQSPDEKKLVFIGKMNMWDNTKTDHYADYIKNLFADSDYFYVTEDENLADFVIVPSLKKAKVSDIDVNNNKMQMQSSLQIISDKFADFAPWEDQQNHFILFDVTEDEQEVADTLIKKLLLKSSKNTSKKLETYISQKLENKQVKGK
ncbi:MAG: hypothetical protein IJ564_03195 [Alphaproteobacteria bacterium]|nr:hypothetical protein [Alphaproteobacteria bacterium]